MARRPHVRAFSIVRNVAKVIVVLEFLPYYNEISTLK